MGVRKLVQKFIRRLIPEAIRDKAKTVIGSLGAVVQVVNLTLPDYGDEAKAIVGTIIAAATFLGIYEVPNVPADEAAAVGDQARVKHQRP